MVKSNDKALVIHSIPYLTNTFIIPNIKSFKALYPDLRISIESKVERAQLNEPHRQELQVGLRHGKGDDDSFQYDEIVPVKISPVCSPGYSLEGALTQINLSTDSVSWMKWQSEWKTTLSFDDSLSCDGMNAVVDMAEQGLGIAMGYFPFISHKVNSGKLLLPYPDMLSDLDSLYLAYPKKDQGEPLINALLSWLKEIVKV
jgi:DNA-binding transcriptional LysR family regulator